MPEKWQLGFQDESTPIAAGIIDFYNSALYYLILVFSLVTYFVLLFSFRFFLSSSLSNHSLSWIKKRNHSTFLELIWTLSPGFILIAIALPSIKLLYALDEVLIPNITLKAIGHQWYWSYEINDIDGLSINFDSYTLDPSNFLVPFDPSTEISFRLLDVDNSVKLPILVPIRLLVSSLDVIHSFFVPSLGVKIDAIPGRLNHASIFLLRPGKFYGQCTELCGEGHSRMSILIEGVDTPSYLSWLLSLSSS